MVITATEIAGKGSDSLMLHAAGSMLLRGLTLWATEVRFDGWDAVDRTTIEPRASGMQCSARRFVARRCPVDVSSSWPASNDGTYGTFING